MNRLCRSIVSAGLSTHIYAQHLNKLQGAAEGTEKELAFRLIRGFSAEMIRCALARRKALSEFDDILGDTLHFSAR
jgi:hypothetical protein